MQQSAGGALAPQSRVPNPRDVLGQVILRAQPP
jgi:hypothetical protein